MRLARGGLSWVVAAALVGGLCILAGNRTSSPGWYVLGILPSALFLFFLVFFRDPERAVAQGVASPADGRVRAVDEVDDPELGRMSRLSIFMSPKDVHVNRAPLAGTVASVTRRPGGFVPAFRKEAEVNERVETILATEIGQVKVVQIAGAVARRIVPYLRPGQTVAKGERLGLIRLGSRCDLLVPPGTVRWTAEVDRQVRAGSSPVGDVA